jgi:hypothetical protein
MGRAPLLAAFLAILVLGSGCLSRGDDRPDFKGIQEEAEQLAAPILVQEHGAADGHRNAALHAGAFNVRLLGYSNGIDSSGDPDSIPALGTYSELALAQDYAYQARNSVDGSFGGFVVYDIRNASRPFPIGEFDAQGGSDLEVNDRQTLAFLSTQRNTGDQVLGAIGQTMDPTAGLPRGISIVDISDKTHPVLEAFVPLPVNGPHTVTYHHHQGDGNEYLIVCTYDLLTDPGTGALLGVIPLTQRVLVYQVVENPAPVGPAAGLVLVSQFQITDRAPAGQLFFPHDTRVQEWGNATYLYVAYWDKGLRILDFSSPMTTPVLPEVGGHTEFSPSALNALHLAQPFDELIDGRHVTVTEPEIVTAPDETGQLTFLDTTNPGDIEKLGHWTLPPGESGQLGVVGLDFSPHNFDLWDGKVAIGHYHAGVWIIDVGDEKNLQDPKTVGWYMPAKPRTASPTNQPNVWGAYVQGDLIYVTDQATGLYILEYTGP